MTDLSVNISQFNCSIFSFVWCQFRSNRPHWTQAWHGGCEYTAVQDIHPTKSVNANDLWASRTVIEQRHQGERRQILYSFNFFFLKSVKGGGYCDNWAFICRPYSILAHTRGLGWSEKLCSIHISHVDSRNVTAWGITVVSQGGG